MNKIRINILSALYLLIIFLLFLYSYTQVDLGLTLSKASIFQTIEKSFQYIGYFQRSLSTSFFIVLILLLFIFYGVFLLLASQNILSSKQFWIIILYTTILLTFSYNAFSYDLFNYIFDAKIITHYHQNPYQHMALDYSKDPMLSFMHWVERKYPYGPIWLLITLPLSYLGFQYFLPTFFIFKIFTSICFIVNLYFIGRILNMQKHEKKNEAVFGMTLFALNPLILIEGLISAHNEIPMIGLSLIAFFLLLNKNYLWSIILLLLSIGIKFSTIFLIPIFLYVIISKNKKHNLSTLFIYSALLMIPAVILLSYRTNFQPWYLLVILPYAVLGGRRMLTILPIFTMSFFSLLEYIPFLWAGNWNCICEKTLRISIPSILFWLTILGVIFSVMSMLILKRKKMLQFIS